MFPMDPDLARRLREAGVDPAQIADPNESWERLYVAFGLRATLIDWRRSALVWRPGGRLRVVAP
ncbi:MAG: hypothetical protein ACRDXD_11360, partial [Acidimicrobiia bacterium]